MIKVLCIAVLGAVLAAGTALAQEQKTIRGEVVGVSCYTQASAGQGDAQSSCSLSALKAGEPAGIVDQKTGKLYIAISGDGTNVSDKLLPNVAKLVDVTGNVQEKQGVNTITVNEVRPVENASSQAGMTNPDNRTNVTKPGNVTEPRGLESGALGSGDERRPDVPWGTSGATSINDTLYDRDKDPGIHNASTREIPGIPNRGTRTGEVYLDEGPAGRPRPGVNTTGNATNNTYPYP
ncbi:MAG: hypothetical protein ACM3OC_08530 [Deltaproteobacteria bacterium]